MEEEGKNWKVLQQVGFLSSSKLPILQIFTSFSTVLSQGVTVSARPKFFIISLYLGFEYKDFLKLLAIAQLWEIVASERKSYGDATVRRMLDDLYYEITQNTPLILNMRNWYILYVLWNDEVNNLDCRLWFHLQNHKKQVVHFLL